MSAAEGGQHPEGADVGPGACSTRASSPASAADAVRQSVIHEYPRLGFKREFAGLLRAEAKQVPRGRAWYLHRFAVSDLSIRLAPFRD
jgi:hypothetical protein